MYVMPGCSGCAGNSAAGCGAASGAEVSVGGGAASDAEVSAIYKKHYSNVFTDKFKTPSY
jgi:hypothetical protein